MHRRERLVARDLIDTAADDLFWRTADPLRAQPVDPDVLLVAAAEIDRRRHRVGDDLQLLAGFVERLLAPLLLRRVAAGGADEAVSRPVAQGELRAADMAGALLRRKRELIGARRVRRKDFV